MNLLSISRLICKHYTLFYPLSSVLPDDAKKIVIEFYDACSSQSYLDADPDRS